MAQTRKTRTQTQRHKKIGKKATPAWIVTDHDPGGRPWFSVRLFFGLDQGPSYFGPFADKQEAEAFYIRAHDCIDQAIFELRNPKSPDRM